MSSNIDPTHPADGAPVSKARERANWLAVKTEMEHGGFFTPSAAPGESQHTVASRLDRTIHAREFGVLGDGGDYTVELQAALDAAEGKSLVIEGTSRIALGLQVRSNCNILGIDGATIKTTSSLSDYGGGAILNFIDVKNVNVRNIEIDGESNFLPHGNFSATGIVMNNASRVVIEDCFIHDMRAPDMDTYWAEGIIIGSSKNIWIKNNIVTNPQRNCISLWSGADKEPNENIYILGNSLSSPRIRNCILVSSNSSVANSKVVISGNYLFNANSLEALRLSGRYNSIIVGNWFYNNRRAMRMTPNTEHNAIIANNYMQTSQEEHIILQANAKYHSNIHITNNFMADAGSHDIRLSSGFLHEAGSERTLIDVKGNTFVNGAGMQFVSDPRIGPLVFCISVVGNSVFNPSFVGLRIEGIDRPIVTGNRFDGNAETAISISNSDRPIVKDNQISGNWRHGPLLFEGLSNEILQDNQV